MSVMSKLPLATSRSEILRALYYRSAPIGLRPLARVANVQLRSAQWALKSLASEGWVVKSLDRKRYVYELDRSHKEFHALQAVFKAASKAFIESRSNALQERAAQIVPFIEEVGQLVRNARKAHVA